MNITVVTEKTALEVSITLIVVFVLYAFTKIEFLRGKKFNELQRTQRRNR
ncbi:MAG: hypothetical protein J7L45_01720 [Candidatus Aenigmarchaeota archaeon]|nr:hypothetical protein [Candidatus Aenigmarchaeota archaeon]